MFTCSSRDDGEVDYDCGGGGGDGEDDDGGGGGRDD